MAKLVRLKNTIGIIYISATNVSVHEALERYPKYVKWQWHTVEGIGQEARRVK
jgi:hypothetical protein